MKIKMHTSNKQTNKFLYPNKKDKNNVIKKIELHIKLMKEKERP